MSKRERTIAVVFVPNPWILLGFRYEHAKGVTWHKHIVPALKRYFKSRGVKPTDMGVDSIMLYERGQSYSDLVLDWWNTTKQARIIYIDGEFEDCPPN